MRKVALRQIVMNLILLGRKATKRAFKKEASKKSSIEFRQSLEIEHLNFPQVQVPKSLQVQRAPYPLKVVLRFQAIWMFQY